MKPTDEQFEQLADALRDIAGGQYESGYAAQLATAALDRAGVADRTPPEPIHQRTCNRTMGLDPCDCDHAERWARWNAENARHFVNEYVVERRYGGPEEGGWWYDAGRFVRQHGAFVSEIRAEELFERLLPRIEQQNDGKAPLDSVGSIGVGRHELMIDEHPGRNYPDRVPHYE